MLKRVYMFVMNNCSHDARVLKEARSLTQAGYRVTIIAVLDKTTAPCEVRDGFEIVRVIKNPVHYKVLRAIRRVKRVLHQFFVRLYHYACVFKSRLTVFLQRLLRAESQGSASFQTAVRELRGIGRLLAALVIVLLFPFRLTLKLLRPLRAFLGARGVAFLMLFHKPLSFLDYYIRAYRIVRSSPGDIYHAHDLNTLPVAWWAKKRLGGRLVYDSHELYVERNRAKRTTWIGKHCLRQIESFLIHQCDTVITVNESLSRELARRYNVPAPNVVMNTPKSTVSRPTSQEGRLRRALSIRPGYRLLLYIGGITFNRGLEKVIEGLVYLPDCCFVLMGYGVAQYKKQLLDLAERYEVDDRVLFFGPVPYEEVASYAADADLGIASIENVCLSYYYCSPNKVFEYISAGLPVAASGFPELKKIVEGNGIGVTFDPEDPKDIARAIRSILEDKEAQEQMRANAREAAKLYNWEREEKKLIEIYRGLYK